MEDKKKETKDVFGYFDGYVDDKDKDIIRVRLNKDGTVSKRDNDVMDEMLGE